MNERGNISVEYLFVLLFVCVGAALALLHLTHLLVDYYEDLVAAVQFPAP